MIDANTPSPVKTRHFTWRWYDVLLIIAASMIIIFVGILVIEIVAQFSPGSLPESNATTLKISVALTALEGFALIGGVCLGLLRRSYRWSAVGIRPLSSNWKRQAILIGLLVIPASGLLALGIQALLGIPFSNPQLPFLAPEGFSWFGFIGLLLLGGILVPIAEELFFRGVLYEWLRDRWGFWLGMLVSSAIFGLLHGEISIAITAAILGGVLAWSYERSNSLWSPIIIHILNNSSKIILIYALLYLGVNINA